MAKQSTMHFNERVDFFRSEKILMLGTVDKTAWYLRCLYVVDDKIHYFEITRIGDSGKVEIDIDVRFTKSCCVLSYYAQPLLDGQKILRLECIHGSLFGTMNTSLQGYVTVRYNPIYTLTNKKEKFTQRNNVHPNCQSTSKKEVFTQTEKEFAKIAEKSLLSSQHESDLLHLLDNPNLFLDTTLVCGSANIPVHRNILSLKSPVFADMFKTQLQEGVHGTVDIVDMDPDVMYAMLVYIYSGKTDHYTHSQAGDLLLAAEKYQLKELKLVCVEQLKVNTAADNVFRSLVLGDLHDKSLKEHAVEFICQNKNFSDLEKTEDWKVLLKMRPSLAMEVTTAIVKYLQNK